MTTWLPVLGVLLLVLVPLLRLLTKRRNATPVLGGTSAPPAGTRQEPSMVEVSSALQGSLRAVRAATEKCSSAHGDDLIAARQELRTVLYEWVAKLEALAREAPPKSRLPRMMRLTSDELWEMAEPWLSYEFVVAHRVKLTTSEMSELQRDTWSRAEAAIAAYGETRGDDEVAARERLTRLADQIKTSSETVMPGAAMSERQLLMWRLAADEIGGFVADAVARHPERR